MHGGLRGVVQAACDVFAVYWAYNGLNMVTTCICAHLMLRCAAVVCVLRSSWRLRLLAAKKKIGLTCKPGQEARAAQAGLSALVPALRAVSVHRGSRIHGFIVQAAHKGAGMRR